MAKQLKLRRGTTSQHSSFTGAEGEVTVDTTKDTLVVHDGSTAGGIPLAKESAIPSTYTHPNHSGEVTSTGDGATVIADNIVDEANLKVSNSPTNGYALTAQSGNTGGLTWAEISASPGGSNTQLQYNSSGSFAGSANLTFDGTNLALADEKEIQIGGTDKLTLRTKNSWGYSYIESDQTLYIGNSTGTLNLMGNGSTSRMSVGSSVTVYGNMNVNGTLGATTINLPSSQQSPLIYKSSSNSIYPSSVITTPPNLSNSGNGGAYNFVVGYYAGNSLTSGAYCTLIGANAGSAITTGDYNGTTAIGPDAVRYGTGNGNLGIGYQAGRFSNSGTPTGQQNIALKSTFWSGTSCDYNVGIGQNTFGSLTTGDKNIAIGYNAAQVLSSGGDNIYMGDSAGSQAAGYQNIGLGKGAAYNADSHDNVAIGNNAGYYLDSGDYNTCIGQYAGFSQGWTSTRTGDHNCVIGYLSGGSLQGGNRNIGIGDNSLANTTNGFDNVLLGSSSGRHLGANAQENIGIGTNALNGASSSNSPQYNIGIGSYAMSQITTGTRNIAIGYHANRYGTTNEYNIAIGHEAMQTGVTTGNYNTCIGRSAGNDLTSGGTNVLLGYYAGKNITTGPGNIYLGEEAGYFSQATQTAELNIGIGKYAGSRITSGSINVMLGNWAGRYVTTGTYNILIGSEAGSSSSPSGNITTGSHIICLGNNSTTDLYCNDTSISSSDKRDKTDVTDFTHGLKWVEQLKPVTYRWDKRAWYNEYNEDGTLKTAVTPDGSKKRARQHIGFLAQDVLAVEQADGFASKKDDMLVVNLNEDDTAYGLKYERLVPVLVNAVKELSAKVKALEAK